MPQAGHVVLRYPTRWRTSECSHTVINTAAMKAMFLDSFFSVHRWLRTSSAKIASGTTCCNAWWVDFFCRQLFLHRFLRWVPVVNFLASSSLHRKELRTCVNTDDTSTWYASGRPVTVWKAWRHDGCLKCKHGRPPSLTGVAYLVKISWTAGSGSYHFLSSSFSHTDATFGMVNLKGFIVLDTIINSFSLSMNPTINWWTELSIGNSFFVVCFSFFTIFNEVNSGPASISSPNKPRCVVSWRKRDTLAFLSSQHL